MGSRYSDRYQAFLARLRQARLDAGLTQVAVADKLGKPQSYVSKIETGERRIDPLELEDLAILYGTSVGRFFGEKAKN